MTQASPSRALGDLHFAQHRTRHFELLDKVTREIREFVHLLAELDQGVGAFLVDTIES